MGNDDFYDGGNDAVGTGYGEGSFLSGGILPFKKYVKAAVGRECMGISGKSRPLFKEAVSALGMRPKMESRGTYMGLFLSWVAVSGRRHAAG